MQPRIVIAHDYLTQQGGAERVVLAMLAAFPDARLVTALFNPGKTFPEFSARTVETTWLNGIRRFREDPRLALPALAPVISRHVIHEADVVLVSSSGWAHGFPAPGARKVVYCHNPPRWLHQRREYIQEANVAVRSASRVLAPPLARWDRRAAASADLYLANSTAVRSRIQKAYGISPTVLFPPVTLAREQTREHVPGLPSDFLLTVSRRRGYKNLASLLEAFRLLPDVPLVVVGSDSGAAWPGNVVGLQDVTDTQLRWLYANCRGLVAVSYEDFGLTPVEGYVFGKPNVLLRAGGYLDSSVEGLTTVFVDRIAPDTIASAVRDLLRRHWSPDAIKQHAEQFSTDAFASRLRSALQSALELRLTSDASKGQT